MRNVLCSAVAVSAALFAVQCSAAAEPAASATVADGLVELAWSDGGDDRTRVALALPAYKGCATVELARDKREIKVGVCRESPDAEPPLLQFSVERFDHGGNVNTLKLHAIARLKRGGSVVIGRFQPGGPASELVATLR